MVSVNPSGGGGSSTTGDLTDHLLSTSVWTDQDVAAAGIPMIDVPFVTIGGGMGSFALVDLLRIAGVRTNQIKVLAQNPVPYQTYRYLCANSQINLDSRIRSDSSSVMDNIWGWPGYAVREAFGKRPEGFLKPLWSVFSEPIVADYWTPQAGQVFRSVDREMSRIALERHARAGPGAHGPQALRGRLLRAPHAAGGLGADAPGGVPLPVRPRGRRLPRPAVPARPAGVPPEAQRLPPRRERVRAARPRVRGVGASPVDGRRAGLGRRRHPDPRPPDRRSPEQGRPDHDLAPVPQLRLRAGRPADLPPVRRERLRLPGLQLLPGGLGRHGEVQARRASRGPIGRRTSVPSAGPTRRGARSGRTSWRSGGRRGSTGPTSARSRTSCPGPTG